MKNVDVEIYLSQLISFFDKNPNDFIDLIGSENKELFYDMVKEQCYKNVEKGEDVSLTRNQLLEIAFSIKNKDKDQTVKIVDGVYQNTKFGKICLN